MTRCGKAPTSTTIELRAQPSKTTTNSSLFFSNHTLLNMKYFSILTATAVFSASLVHSSAIAERAVLDGPCTGKGNAPGVCVATSKCSSSGGTFISNACPGTPNDVKCCTKTQCSSNGNCRWTSSCNGSTVSNQCPGPASFVCCVPQATSGAGYPPPALPLVGACKAKAVSGAGIIVKGNPGKVRQIYCTRKCECGKDPSDHCCGMATDMMCSSAGGVCVSHPAAPESAKFTVYHTYSGPNRVRQSDC